MTPLRAFNETLLFYCPKFSSRESAVLRAAYDALLAGAPVSLTDLSQLVGMSLQALDDHLARWPGLAQFDEDGRIDGYLGLSLRSTPHAIVVNGQTLHTWCVWDGLFIPRVIGREARLTSSCPLSNEAIAVGVAPHGLVEVHPASVVMSFVTARAASGNCVGVCCPDVHFLQSAEAGAEWQVRNPMGSVLSIEEAWDLAKSFVDTRLLAADVVAPPA